MSHTDTKSTDDVSRTDADHFVLGGGPLVVAVANDLGKRGQAAVVIDEPVDAPNVPVLAGTPTDTGHASIRATSAISKTGAEQV